MPQSRQLPPEPFDREALQRVYFDVNRVRPYSQFLFLPGDTGAQMMNGPQDRIVVTPQLVQIFTMVDSTTGRARELTTDVLKAVAERLKIEHFLQLAIDVQAHVPAPGERPDAREFIKEQVLKGSPNPEDLGADFFAGGVKFRRFDEKAGIDENLSVEPLAVDNTFLWLDYNVQRFQLVTSVDAVSEAIDDAFKFMSGPAITILEA